MGKHFAGRDALSHVLEKRSQGTLEAHGLEMPGHLSAAADSARESAVAFLLFWLFLTFFHIPVFPAFAAFGVGWAAWKMGRSGWLGWTRLERLHRLIEQEKYEIEHHRPQEREELVALYQAKGFEGRLLEEVVDVLMADQDRLLKVMLEEEMGLTLEAYEHPVQLAVGAGVGVLLAWLFSVPLIYWLPHYGMLIAAFAILSVSAIFSARFEGNRAIPALIWNLSIGALSLGAAYFIFQL